MLALLQETNFVQNFLAYECAFSIYCIPAIFGLHSNAAVEFIFDLHGSVDSRY